jgi:hypothetical protein
MNPLVAELFTLCTCGHPLVNHLIGRTGKRLDCVHYENGKACKCLKSGLPVFIDPSIIVRRDGD